MRRVLSFSPVLRSVSMARLGALAPRWARLALLSLAFWMGVTADSSAKAKTDVIRLSNGDTVTGEVTKLERYYNVNLGRHPYSQWSVEERRT